MLSLVNGTDGSLVGRKATFERRAIGSDRANLVWDVIYRHAPDEYLRDTRADPEWEWKAHPEVREAVRPLVAQEAKVASFLLEKGMALNQEAIDLFLDAVEDNFLQAYVGLRLSPGATTG